MRRICETWEIRLTRSALIRWSGLATVVVGLGFVLFPLLHADHDANGYMSRIWVPAHMLPNVGAILVLFGLVGRLARDWSGLAGLAFRNGPGRRLWPT